MKKIIPFLTSFICAFLILLFWDKIKLPYDESNLLIGNYYDNKINPLNDTIRFLIFLVFPFLVYLLTFIKLNKDIFSLNPKNKNYFLNCSKANNQDILKYYFFFFIIFISLEFLAVDLRIFVTDVDFFHDGTFLVPAINYLEKGNLFGSTLYDYGYIANNLAVISSYFFGSLTLGSFILLELILIYLIKFSLVLISKNVVLSLNVDDFLKKTFFIIFTFIIISLPDYYDHYRNFSPRSLLYLIFILLLGSAISAKDNKPQLLIIGFFSLASVLWWFDIGAYVNALIFLTLIYFIIHKEIKNFFILSICILLSWGIFIFALSPESLKNFFYQLSFIYTVSDYLLGIEYRIPFTSSSGRWTKVLIIFYFISIMLIHLNLSKKFRINFKTKIFLNLLFLGGIIGFKSALMRSDSYHIKYSSGILVLIILFLIIFFIFQRFKLSDHMKTILIKFKLNIVILLSLSFFSFSGMSDSNHNLSSYSKLKNIINFKKDLVYLVNSNDSKYLNDINSLVTERYKKISEKDNCVQILTDDISFPYFLKKPTCTQFFIPAVQIINGKSEALFLKQLNASLPNIILYKSPNNILINPLNMPNTLKFIEQKYSFYENFNGYIFYKKK